MGKLFSSPKTTVAGIAAILTALGSLGTAWASDAPVDYASAISAILAGIGLIAARDNGKRSEDVGAGK